MAPLRLPRAMLARTVLLMFPAFASCGSWTRVGETQRPDTQAEAAEMLDPDALYTRLGRFVSPAPVHFIGSVAFVPGRGDSTAALIGISVANRAFSFEKQVNGFSARYRVEYEFDRPAASPIIVGRTEDIRLNTFQETVRSDESILLQQSVQLQPGDYQITVRLRDLNSGNVGTASERLHAPDFVPGTFTAPVLTYRVHARSSRDDSLAIVLNPRGTISYGGDTLLVYFEGVGFHGPHDIPLQVRDQRDSVVYRTTAHFTGATEIEGRVIRMSPDSAPLGQLEIILGPEHGAAAAAASGQAQIVAGPENVIRTTSAVVSFSDAWVVTNFDDLIPLLRFFGEDRRLAALKRTRGAERDSVWREFYHATDPNPSTPENEALDAYFSRLAFANREYHEPGFPGWRTDRGEVYIVLGPPDQIHDESAELQNYTRIILWAYPDYQATFTFQDVSGFGRFQLTPLSRSQFEQIRVRVQRPAP